MLRPPLASAYLPLRASCAPTAYQCSFIVVLDDIRTCSTTSDIQHEIEAEIGEHRAGSGSSASCSEDLAGGSGSTWKSLAEPMLPSGIVAL